MKRNSFRFQRNLLTIISILLLALLVLLLLKTDLPGQAKESHTKALEDQINAKNNTIKDLNEKLKKAQDQIKKLEKKSENEQKDEETEENKKTSDTGDFSDREKNIYNISEVKSNMENPDYKGKKLAFLTFDDGPGRHTSKLLDILRKNNVKATFFIAGKNLNDSTSKNLIRIYKEEHSIGSHSFSHDYSILYPNKMANADIIVKEHQDTLSAMRKYLGDSFNTGIFRYPGGHMSWDKTSMIKADEALNKIGVDWIDWNAMTGDAQPVDAGPNDISRPQNRDQVISNFERSLTFTANPNQIVILMHDSNDKELTIDALDKLIKHIYSKGYEFAIMK